MFESDEENATQIKPKSRNRIIPEDLSNNNQKCVVEFASTSYAVFENSQKCFIKIERYGKIDQPVHFKSVLYNLLLEQRSRGISMNIPQGVRQCTSGYFNVP